MSGREAVHLLVDVVAKGGNLLLNVAPGPDGTWQQGAYDLLAEMGAWLKVNGEAIYGSRPIAPSRTGKLRHDARARTAACTSSTWPAMTSPGCRGRCACPRGRPAAGARVTLLGSAGGAVVDSPTAAASSWPCRSGCAPALPAGYAWTIKVSRMQEPRRRRDPEPRQRREDRQAGREVQRRLPSEHLAQQRREHRRHHAADIAARVHDRAAGAAPVRRPCPPPSSRTGSRRTGPAPWRRPATTPPARPPPCARRWR